FCGACGNNRTNRGGFQFAAARLPWFSFNADTLPERLVRQTLFRANRLLMEAYTEILELEACFKD
ncbi:hypothetical protein IEKLDGGM_21665, partial [Escherichia coli]|nr:hypothetical protein [Escherichia coli]MEC4797787.1 hypothetical protein [Escherichia coli]